MGLRTLGHTKELCCPNSSHVEVRSQKHGNALENE